jgi:glutaredoxin
MSEPDIVVYLKPFCGWSRGVLAVLEKYGLPYESRDVIKDPAAFKEMYEKTGQTAAPCVEIDGVVLADIGGEELESFLVESGRAVPSFRGESP